MVAASQHKLLLSLLSEKLHLQTASREQVENLFNTACEYLERQRGSSPSLLQEQPCAEDVWAPCIVWLLKSIPGLLSNIPGEAGAQAANTACLPLSELLDACGISLVSFFKELPVVLNKLKPWLLGVTTDAENVENVLRLREWQETLVSLTHLANKYKDLFWHIQRSNSSSASKQPVLRAGWLCFLVIKAQLLPGFPDLVSCLELLVCVLNMLLASSVFSTQQLQELQQQSPAAIGPTGKFNLLKALSQEAKVDFANTQVLMPQIEARFRAHLEEASFAWLPQPLPSELPHPQAGELETCCSLYLEGLVSNQQQLSELVLSLDAGYQTWYNQHGEIDEREFLLTDFGALASPRALPGASILMPGAAVGSGGGDSRTAPTKEQPSVNGSSMHVQESDAAGAAAAAAPHSGAVPAQQLSPLAALAAAAASSQQQQQQRQVHHQQQQHGQKPPLVPGGLARKAGLVLQGLQSPLPMMNLGPPGPATPISQAMGSVSWLRGLVRGLQIDPSPSLQRYMEAAGADAGPVLVERVKAAAAAVFMSDAAGDPVVSGGLQGLQHGLAQERQTEGIKLYWHVLEAMLKAEEARAGLPAAGALLTRWSFHQCLLACAFEVVAASYRMGLLSFPAIPTKLGLKPFDLSKMIGPFVKAEPTLPRQLKRHMFTVEEKILESLGWAPGSSFYKLIRAAAGPQQPQAAPAAARSASPAQPEAAAAAAEAGEQQSADEQMQDVSELQPGMLPSSEQQQDLQREAAAAAAVDAEAGMGTSAVAADAHRRPSAQQGLKRSSETGSGDPMDTDTASRASASPSLLSVAAKRQRGHDGQATDSPRNSPAFAVPAEEQPLPRALGPPPGSSGVLGAAAGAAGGGDPSARAVLHDYCRKVLKLAAFRLVAVSEGLDFSPMTREDVVAHVHELLAAALYQHTFLFYSRHLDTLLLASLYGYCKVNRLHKITFREIIAHYKRQAHAKQEVFRTVVLQQTDPHLITQATADIIAFYNAVFVPVMKNVLLTISQPPAADPAAASSSQQTPNGQHANGAMPDAAAAKPSPMQTAMQLTAALPQQQQQRSRASTGAVVSPGSAGTAYRALSLPGASGGGSSSNSMGLAELAGGGALLGGLAPSPGAEHAGASDPSLQPLGGSNASSSFWTGTEDTPMQAAVDMAATAPTGALAAAGGGSMPSRLSRLSRPDAAGAAGAAVRVAAGPVPAAAGPLQASKAAAGSLQQQYHSAPADAAVSVGREGSWAGGSAAAAAAADLMQQPDQVRAGAGLNGGQEASLARHSSSNAGRSDSEAYSTSGTSGDPFGSSGEDQPGSSSPAGHTGASSEGLQQQERRMQPPQQAIAAAAAAGTSGSPSAGLATLLQALDTKSAGARAPTPAASSGQGYESTLVTNNAAMTSHPGNQPGHLPSSCAQQQAAAMVDM